MHLHYDSRDMCRETYSHTVVYMGDVPYACALCDFSKLCDSTNFVRVSLLNCFKGVRAFKKCITINSQSSDRKYTPADLMYLKHYHFDDTQLMTLVHLDCYQTCIDGSGGWLQIIRLTGSCVNGICHAGQNKRGGMPTRRLLTRLDKSDFNFPQPTEHFTCDGRTS